MSATTHQPCRAVQTQGEERRKGGEAKKFNLSTQHRDWWIAVKLLWGSVRKRLNCCPFASRQLGHVAFISWLMHKEKEIHLINWQLSSIRYLSRKEKREFLPDRSDDVESGQAVKSEKWTLRILYELTSDRKKLARLSHVLNALSWPRRFYGCKL